MHRLGISVYPEHSTFKKDSAYMELASKYGYSRIFTCLLSVKKPKEEIVHTMLQEEMYYVFSDFKAYALRKNIEYKRLV